VAELRHRLLGAARIKDERGRVAAPAPLLPG
jgi:hypothetical protein